MLRPSTLTALGVPSGTSLMAATLTKLDSVFDIWNAPLLFKRLHGRLPFGEAHGGVRGGSAVLVHANVRSVASEADEKLVAGGMSGAECWVCPARALPLLEHGAQRGQDLGVGVIPEHDSPHLMEQPGPRVSGVQVLQHLPAHILDVERRDGVEDD